MDVQTRDFSEDLRRLEFNLQEENQALRTTIGFFKTELERLKQPPLVVCEVVKIINDKALIRLANSNKFYVNIVSELIGKIKVGDRVLAEQKTLSIVQRLDEAKRMDVENFLLIQKPKETFEEIGGLKEQINEIKEVIELPLLKPELFKKIGIEPPKGILLYGPSGTGKTKLAKAVANSTNATFIEIVGSELVQKYIGEGAKLVKDLFKLAKEKAPSIIFIDELDAIAAERIELGTSGEREVQRTFMQLLSEIDGFKSLGNVKIIGATNRVDILDPAILRPGRLDRLIEVPLPSKDGRKEIFKIHSNNMKFDKVDDEKIVNLMDGFSGAQIRSVCTEAGYFAIRENRSKILHNDLVEAVKKINQDKGSDEHLIMFG